MALIIEDGTQVADAVSYVDKAYVIGFALARGVTFPSADAEAEALIVKAMDYVEGVEERFLGTRVSADQELSWPRAGVYLHGFEVAEDSIPKPLKKAVAQLAIEAMTQDLAPNGTGKEVIRKKLDVIETQYAETGSSLATPIFPKVEAFLDQLTSGGSLELTLEHV